MQACFLRYSLVSGRITVLRLPSCMFCLAFCQPSTVEISRLWSCWTSLGHWLYMPQRITFKVAVLTYCVLYGSALPYLASSFTCVADISHQQRLRSTSTDQIDVPFFRRSTVGCRAFPVAEAKVWNSLPSDVTSAPSLPVFRNRMKTYLFCHCCDTV